MDRDLESLETAPGFSWRRLAVTVLVSAAVLVAGSYVVRSFPNSGYDAGYDAVMTEGQTAVEGLVEAAGGVSLPLCDELHAEIDRQADESRYDYTTFIEGCRAAVDQLVGAPVPLARDAA